MNDNCCTTDKVEYDYFQRAATDDEWRPVTGKWSANDDTVVNWYNNRGSYGSTQYKRVPKPKPRYRHDWKYLSSVHWQRTEAGHPDPVPCTEWVVNGSASFCLARHPDLSIVVYRRLLVS